MLCSNEQLCSDLLKCAATVLSDKRAGLTNRAFHQTIRRVLFVFFETHLFFSPDYWTTDFNEIKCNYVFESTHPLVCGSALLTTFTIACLPRIYCYPYGE